MLRPLRFNIQNQPFYMLPVEGGLFQMGMEKNDPDAFGLEQPVHLVQVSTFYLAQYPVTQALWAALMGREEKERTPHFSGDSRPMEQVSWNDAKLFLDKLRAATEMNFRLPSESEREYAARGGIFNAGMKYAGSQRLKEIGWCEANSHGETKLVGRKSPNELGLYEMSGNVWEWCEDDWHYDYQKAPKDGSAWIDTGRGLGRVLRGGSWFDRPQNCRSAYRMIGPPARRYHSCGLRLALSLAGEVAEGGTEEM